MSQKTKYTHTHTWLDVVAHLILAPQRQRQVDLCELEANLASIASSRIVRDMYRDPVSKNLAYLCIYLHLHAHTHTRACARARVHSAP